MGLIYKLTSPSGKSYIGMTLRTMEQRMKEHTRHDSKCMYLVHGINKYGFDNFIKEVIWKGEDSQTPEIEREMIIKHDTLSPNGYNLRSGGGCGERISEELRQKFSIIQREASKERNDGLLGSIATNTLVSGEVRYRLFWGGKHVGTFKTLEECKKVQTNLTDKPDIYLLEYINENPRQIGTVYLSCDNTWIIKVTIDGKQVEFGRRKTEKEARELLAYILEMGFKTKKELVSSLPTKQTGSSVYFIKTDGTWGIKVPINGKQKSFGQCKTKEIGWKLVDYIRDKSIETKQQLLDSLKSNGLVEYLEQYLPKIKRTGRVRKMGNTYQAILRGKFVGSFKTEQEAEDAITSVNPYPLCSTSFP